MVSPPIPAPTTTAFIAASVRPDEFETPAARAPGRPPSRARSTDGDAPSRPVTVRVMCPWSANPVSAATADRSSSPLSSRSSTACDSEVGAVLRDRRAGDLAEHSRQVVGRRPDPAGQLEQSDRLVERRVQQLDAVGDESSADRRRRVAATDRPAAGGDDEAAVGELDDADLDVQIVAAQRRGPAAGGPAPPRGSTATGPADRFEVRQS